MDTSLSSFGAGSAEPTGGLVGVANAAYLTEPPERENVKGWKQPSTEHGLTTHQVATGYGGGNSHKAAEHEVRWVSGGDLAGYVEDHGDELRSLPQTYSGFSGGAFDPYVGCVDGLLEDHYGYGVSGTAAERALRILNDNGRYQASKYHIITAGEYPWILTGPKGVVLCSPAPVDRTDRNSQAAGIEFTDRVISTEEDNPIVIRALKRVEAFLAGEAPTGAPDGTEIDASAHELMTFYRHEEAPTSTSYGGTDGHVFSTGDSDDSTEIKVPREDLRDIGTMEIDAHNLWGVPGQETVTSPSGFPVTVDYTPERAVGETYDEGLVIGYSFDWRTYSYTSEEVAVLTTYHMGVPSDTSHTQFIVPINRTETRVATTSPHYRG